MTKYTNGNLCIECNARLRKLYFRIGSNNTMIVKHVGKICEYCKRFEITNPIYKEYAHDK